MFKHMIPVPVELIVAAANMFKGLDLNFQFYSTDQLPEKAKEIIGQELDEIFKERESTMNDLEKTFSKALCDSLTGFEFLTTNWGGCAHVVARLPGFS